MVTINIYGLDQFVVGELSERISKDIAKVYEIDEDDVSHISYSVGKSAYDYLVAAVQRHLAAVMCSF